MRAIDLFAPSLLSLSIVLAGCGGGPTPTGSDAATPDVGSAACTRDAECDDGRFCNGAETCMPRSTAADEHGCVPAAMPNPCLAGQVCDEAMNACVTQCTTTEDADGDGARATACGGDDCDDADANAFPMNPEICDASGHDEDCDATTFGDRDLDGDGVVDSACCNGTHCGQDCDDLRRGVSPDSPEVCNGFDDDCDATIDEMSLVQTWPDADFDLHGDATAAAVMHCAGTFGFATVNDDCDDHSPAVHPAQVEICDAIDNNCNGRIDEAPAAVTWYLDADGDGYGSSDPTTTRVSCTPLPGYALRATDCDDTRNGVSPATPERCDGLDNDCSGSPDFFVGANDTEDDDLDGHADLACPSGDDCDDRDPTSYPSATEICDLRDNDCNHLIDDGSAMGSWWIDRDGDTFGDAASTPVLSCAPVRGHALRAGDCDDSSAARRPGSSEVCDGVDDDCDTRIDEGSVRSPYYLDGDGDGLGAGTPVLACARPIDRVDNANDCDDSNRSVGAATIYYVDVDGDAYGDANRSEIDCTPPANRITRGGDCDDTLATTHPMAPEVCGGLDEDCDGSTDEDPDASASCTIPGAVAACTAGACTVSMCSAGLADCSATTPGCETSTDTDGANCGSCGNACMAGERCRDGGCARVVSLAGGQNHVCALLGTGPIACWGQGASGQLGNGTLGNAGPPTTSAQLVQLYTGATITDAIDISSHPQANFTCAVRATGAVVCWGDNASLQIGSDAPGVRAPRAVPIPGITNAVEVVLGANHACARLATGGVVCWGANGAGQLSSNSLTPTMSGMPLVAMEDVGGTPTPISDAIAMSAGREFTCFLHAGRTRVSCAGADGVGSGWGGQLGRGTIPYAHYPLAADVLLPGGSVVMELATGTGYYEGPTCVVLASGTLLCWGINDSYAIAPSGGGVTTPRTIDPLLFASSHHVWIGNASVWIAYDNASFGPRIGANGDSSYGRLGVGSTAPPAGVPADVQTTTGYFTDVQQIVSGAYYTCALLPSGSVTCWGADMTIFADGISGTRYQVQLGTSVPRLP